MTAVKQESDTHSIVAKGISSENTLGAQGSKLTNIHQFVTDENPGGHIDFFTYQSDWP
jgi:hypothetical protein